MLAAVIIGEAIGISSLWIPSYSTVTAFGLLIIVLLVRPEGVRSILMGRPNARIRLPALLSPAGARRGGDRA
jgi:hypothetical protein